MSFTRLALAIFSSVFAEFEQLGPARSRRVFLFLENHENGNASFDKFFTAGIRGEHCLCEGANARRKQEALGAAAAAAAAAAVAHAGHELTWSLLHFNITKLVFGRFEGYIGA